jgi:hypothetical protein
VENSTPAPLITSVLEIFNPRLHIVNVSRETYPPFPPEIEAEKSKLEEMFGRFTTEFHFINKPDFYEALDNFITQLDIDVLVTIPKQKSNSTSLFKSSHTKRLAYHSHIPILAAHE